MQVFDDERTRRNGHHVIRVEALDLDRDTMDVLLRLVCILCGLAPTWLCIDGLDEVRSDCRDKWKLLVRCLLSLPDLMLIATARQEVVAAQLWLQDIGLQERILPRLTERQVSDEFHRVRLPVPENPSLLDVLRTPQLLSFYARVVTRDDMPLAQSGEVTAFQVIKAFWQRTVLSASVGHRSPGDADGSQHPKRLAAEHMLQQTMDGELCLRPGSCAPDVADGYENLRREGVIVRETTYAYRWIHDWVRDYAIIDYIISNISNLNVASLLDQVTSVRVEHVARTAAVAGVKWIIAHPDSGTAQDYLLQLWARNRGHASDVLAVLVEHGSRYLMLNDLPAVLLADLIDQARLIRAWHWRDQVSTLLAGKLLEDEGRLHNSVTAYELEACNE